MAKDLLAVRKAIKDRKPEFKRQIYNHRPNLATTGWRRPKGLHSKMRHKTAGHQACVNVGWGSPVEVSGLHPSGLMPVMVLSVNDVAKLDGKHQGAIIGAGVGKRSKILLIDALAKKNVRILNMKDAKGFASKVHAELKAKKDARAAVKKEEKPAQKAEKKPEPKKEMTPDEQKEHERKEAEKVMIQKER